MVEETEIQVKNLTNGEKFELLQELGNLDQDKGNIFDQMCRIWGKAIISIQGCEEQDPGDVLIAIEDPKTQKLIIDEVKRTLGLEKEEEKN